MRVELIRPRSIRLRKYIQYFFFISNSQANYEKTHICYPNTNYCLGLFKGNKLERLTDANFQVLPSKSYRSYLTGIYQKPINVSYQGSFDEVCIDFEPLGLEMLTGVKISDNVFIQDAVETALPKLRNKIYELAFGSENKFVCAGKLEEFFLANMPEKSKFEFIEFNSLNAIQVDELKKIHYKSYRSIHRLYRESLGLSPKEFLSLLRFRRSIRQIHSADQLTTIAHKEGFSDQAHMSREFRKYTGVSPKIFGTRSTLVGETLCWTLT